MLRIATLLAASAATLAFGAACASAAPGDLDRSFGHGGVVRTQNGSEGRALTLQQNGRIVAVGGYFQCAIEIDRYRRDGDLDPTFGSGGRAKVLDVCADGARYVYPAAVGIDSQGRILVAGALGDSFDQLDIMVVRVLPDGDLDTSFGEGGIVALDPGVQDSAVGLAVRPDDSILVGGYANSGRQDSAFIVARIDDQGDLDPDYGDGGTAIVPMRHRGGVAAMAVDARGRATLADGFPGTTQAHHGGPDRAVDMIRLTGGGELDDTFSGNGRRALDLGRREQGRTLAVGTRGRIFVATSVNGPGRRNVTDLVLARLKRNGRLDRRFSRRGRRGIATTDLKLCPDNWERWDYAADLEPQADGKVVLSAAVDCFVPGDYPADWAALRYTRSGRLDHSFSGNGRAVPRIYGSPPVMAMQPNGRILLLGYSWPDELADPDGFVLARMRNDGRPLGG